MADITAIFFILLFLGISYPGMLTAWWLLFPDAVGKAAIRLERTPWKSFFLGAALGLFVLLPATFLISRPSGVVKVFGFSILAFLLAFSSLGAAGLAALLGGRITLKSNNHLSPLAGFVRGALAIELASIFPLIGWLLVFPLASLASLGAASFALLRWMPKAAPVDLSPTLRAAEATTEMANQ